MTKEDISSQHWKVSILSSGKMDLHCTWGFKKYAQLIHICVLAIELQAWWYIISGIHILFSLNHERKTQQEKFSTVNQITCTSNL